MLDTKVIEVVKLTSLSVSMPNGMPKIAIAQAKAKKTGIT